MAKKNYFSPLLFGVNVLLLLCLAACQPGNQPTAVSRTIETTPTATPPATATASYRPTATPEVEPTPSVTPFPTEITIREPSYAFTPLPPLSGPLTASQAGAIQLGALWGQPRANTIALSPDGQVLGVGTDLGSFFYDSQGYAKLAFLPSGLAVDSIAFAAGNSFAALGQSDGAVTVLEQAGFSVLYEFPPIAAEPSTIAKIDLAFNPDGDELIQVIQTDNFSRVRRWKMTTWQTLADFTIPPGDVTYFSPALDTFGMINDQRLLLQSLSYPEENDLLDLPTTIAPDFWGRLAASSQAVPARSGEFLLIENGYGIVYWQLLAEEYTYLLNDYPDRIPDPCTVAPDTCLNTASGFSWGCEGVSPTPIELIALTPDDVMVLISRNDQRTEFRRTSDTVLVWELDATFTDVAFSPGGEFFFGLRTDGVLEKRTTLDGSLLDAMDQHPGKMTALAFSPDSAILAAGFSDGWVRVFSTINGQMLGVLDGNARSLAFSPDGALLAAGLTDGTVRLFLLNEGERADLQPGHQAAVTSAAFSEDGHLLYTGSEDCTAAVWQVESRAQLKRWFPDPGDPLRIAHLIPGSESSILSITGNRMGFYLYRESFQSFQHWLPKAAIQDLALIPGSDAIVLAGEGIWVQTLPTQNGPLTAPQPLNAENETIDVVAVNPAGDLLATASQNEIAFYSLPEGDLLVERPFATALPAANRPVSLAFSPDGNLLALGLPDGVIAVYSIPSSNQ